jgi:hypothetical protein
VTGLGPVDFVAQNGIQVSYEATAEVSGNSINNNDYTPRSFIACGLLLCNAGGVNTGTNLYRHDESNMCNFGKGGGNFSPTRDPRLAANAGRSSARRRGGWSAQRRARSSYRR